MKIYHVETQQDYDALMIELEDKSCKWRGGEKPTACDNWFMFEEKTYVMEENKRRKQHETISREKSSAAGFDPDRN